MKFESSLLTIISCNYFLHLRRSDSFLGVRSARLLQHHRGVRSSSLSHLNHRPAPKSSPISASIISFSITQTNPHRSEHVCTCQWSLAVLGVLDSPISAVVVKGCYGVFDPAIAHQNEACHFQTFLYRVSHDKREDLFMHLHEGPTDRGEPNLAGRFDCSNLLGLYV